MRWFKDIMAWVSSARGVANFAKRNYVDAAHWLEVACRLDSRLADWEVHTWILGESYLAMGNPDEALKYCLEAYEQLSTRTEEEKDGQLDDEMIESLLETLGRLLEKAGQVERSSEIHADLQRRREKTARRR